MYNVAEFKFTESRTGPGSAHLRRRLRVGGRLPVCMGRSLVTCSSSGGGPPGGRSLRATGGGLPPATAVALKFIPARVWRREAMLEPQATVLRSVMLPLTALPARVGPELLLMKPASAFLASFCCSLEGKWKSSRDCRFCAAVSWGLAPKAFFGAAWQPTCFLGSLSKVLAFLAAAGLGGLFCRVFWAAGAFLLSSAWVGRARSSLDARGLLLFTLWASGACL